MSRGDRKREGKRKVVDMKVGIKIEMAAAVTGGGGSRGREVKEFSLQRYKMRR